MQSLKDKIYSTLAIGTFVLGSLFSDNKNNLNNNEINSSSIIEMSMFGNLENRVNNSFESVPSEESLQEGDNLQEYINTRYRIRMEYPSNWEKLENYMDTIVLFRSQNENPVDDFRENINLVIQDLPEGITTLEEYAKLSIEEIKRSFRNVKIIQQHEINMNNNPGYVIRYTAKFQEEGKYYDLFIGIFCTLKDNKVFSLIYAKEKDNDIFDREAEMIARSFKFY
ncbi:hypothetical protein CL617_00135 [archaeon]|nr:hypothetical protein [archaeon]|tara:strand:+ start:297 stop:971 length:675 start_codon:yes stop_codon:yes gene_type:complete